MARIRPPRRLAAVAVIAAVRSASAWARPRAGVSIARTCKGRSEFAPFNGEGESTHCPRSKARLERNKRNVVGFYTTAFNDKQPERAVARYGGAEYIQHNPLAANGFDAFIAFVNGFTSDVPRPAHRDRAGLRRV